MTRQLEWDTQPDHERGGLGGALLILVLGLCILLVFTADMPPVLFVVACAALIVGSVMLLVWVLRWMR